MRTRSLSNIFAMPLAIAVAIAGGLLSALLGDGAWDALSWLLLGGSLAVAAFCILRARGWSSI